MKNRPCLDICQCCFKKLTGQTWVMVLWLQDIVQLEDVLKFSSIIGLFTFMQCLHLWKFVWHKVHSSYGIVLTLNPPPPFPLPFSPPSIFLPSSSLFLLLPECEPAVYVFMDLAATMPAYHLKGKSIWLEKRLLLLSIKMCKLITLTTFKIQICVKWSTYGDVIR